MDKIRLAISIVGLAAVLAVGLNSTLPSAKAQDMELANPRCNCSGTNYSGRACNSAGKDNSYGPYCCEYRCDVTTD